MDQLNAQYKENAAGLKRMRDKAVMTGKKVNGYTEVQLNELVNKYEKLSR